MENNFTVLFQYNHVANKQLIDALNKCATPPARALELMAHILQAHRVWLNRIQTPGAPSANPWQPLPANEFTATNDALLQQTLEALQQHDATLVLTYLNTRGEQWTDSISDICTQLLTHGSYHRGQIALLLRQAGIDPPNTDYIAYIRSAPAHSKGA